MLTRISIETNDTTMYAKDAISTDIGCAMANNNDIVLDLKSEGPCCNNIGLYILLDYCSLKYCYDLSRVTILTSNKLETHPIIKIKYMPPTHLMHNAMNEYKSFSVNKILDTHFGSFVGKSNSLRLCINSYLYKEHNDKVTQSYRFNPNNDYYRNHIGLEELIRNNQHNIIIESEFISKCPLLLNGACDITYDVNSPLNLSQQLDARFSINRYYDTFFVEIVQESYFSGSTFFPTEKIWRPILLKTPFIVQGPQWYLKHLKEMGFKTFDKWWNEGYSEDPPYHSVKEIKKVIDFLSNKSIEELTQIYFEMTDILEHNYNTLNALTKKR